MLNYPSVRLELSLFLTYLIGDNYPLAPTPSSQAKAKFPIPGKSPLNNGQMRFDRRPTYIIGPVFGGLYCPSTQNMIYRPFTKSL